MQRGVQPHEASAISRSHQPLLDGERS